jgi:hypothetical protein
VSLQVASGKASGRARRGRELHGLAYGWDTVTALALVFATGAAAAVAGLAGVSVDVE